MTRGDARPGTVYWIDHYVVCTNDRFRWEAFHSELLGAATWPEPPELQLHRGIFQTITHNSRGGRGTNHGGFISPHPLPPSKGLGRGLPRYGFFILAADIEAHLRRLDRVGANYRGPIRTSALGDPGIAIDWEDPDGNQFQFWAPDVLPDGAMIGCTPVGVGRISHGVFESRDLDRTAAFFERYCALAPQRSAEIASDALVLPLAAAGRLVFQKVDVLGGRTTGYGLPDAHTALTVRSVDFLSNLDRMWIDLPEWNYDVRAGKKPIDDAETLPARTVLHISPEGRKFKATTGRGEDWLDWDTNMFHFQGGTPIGLSMADYENHAVGDFIDEWTRTRGAQSPRIPAFV